MSIIETIKKELENISTDTQTEEVGVVSAVSDGIVEIEGITAAQMMEMVVFETAEGKSLKDSLEATVETIGLVLNLEEDVVRAVVLGESHGIREGMVVRRTGKLLSIPVGEGIV